MDPNYQANERPSSQKNRWTTIIIPCTSYTCLYKPEDIHVYSHIHVYLHVCAHTYTHAEAQDVSELVESLYAAELQYDPTISPLGTYPRKLKAKI